MSINDRIYIIDNLLNERRSISFQELLARLEVSPATLKRDIAHMRDRLNAPVVFDKELGGYRFGEQGSGAVFTSTRHHSLRLHAGQWSLAKFLSVTILLFPVVKNGKLS